MTCVVQTFRQGSVWMWRCLTHRWFDGGFRSYFEADQAADRHERASRGRFSRNGLCRTYPVKVGNGGFVHSAPPRSRAARSLVLRSHL